MKTDRPRSARCAALPIRVAAMLAAMLSAIAPPAHAQPAAPKAAVDVDAAESVLSLEAALSDANVDLIRLQSNILSPTTAAVYTVPPNLVINRDLTIEGGLSGEGVRPDLVVIRERPLSVTCVNNRINEPSFDAPWVVFPNASPDGNVLFTQVSAVPGYPGGPIAGTVGANVAAIFNNPLSANPYSVNLAPPLGAASGSPSNRLSFKVYTLALGAPVARPQIRVIANNSTVATIDFTGDSTAGFETREVTISPEPTNLPPFAIEVDIPPGIPQFVFLDDFCLTPVVAATALATLNFAGPSPTEPIAVTLRGLTVEGGNRAVAAGANVNLVLDRVLLRGAGTGVFMNGTSLRATSSIFSGGKGAEIAAGWASFFQCSFVDCGGGGIAATTASIVERRDVVACLFRNCTPELAVGPNTFMTHCVFADNPTAVPPVPTYPAGTATYVQLVDPWVSVTDINTLFDDSPGSFPGNLFENATAPVTGLNFADLPDLGTGFNVRDRIIRSRDFEGQGRDDLVQAGADEVTTESAVSWTWSSVRLEYADGSAINGVVGGSPLPAVGRDRELTITVELNGRDLSDTDVYVVPEFLLNGVTGNEADFIRNNLVPFGSVDDAAGESVQSFTNRFSSTYAGGSSLTEAQTLVDGEATVVLDVNGLMIGLPLANGSGLGLNEDRLSGNVEFDARFIIDTTPPTLANPEATALDLLGGSNDTTAAGEIVAPPYNTNLPPGWLPGVADVPAAYGTLGDRFLAPQLFFGAVGAPLDFTIEAAFDDAGPLSSAGTPWAIATAGFTGIATAPSGDALDVLFGAAAGTAPRDLEDGKARWRADGPVPEEEFAGATATASFNSSTGVAEWTVLGVTDTTTDANGWYASLIFEAKDRAGNRVQSNVPLRLWWFQEARGQIRSAPTGASFNVEIGWGIDRAAAPANPAPCPPAASFKMWRTRAGANRNSGWEEISPWSDWTTSPILDENAVIASAPAVVTLGDLLRDPGNAGRRIGISIMAADEAGNVDQPPSEFGQIDMTAPELVNALGNEGVWADWENGVGPSSLDTTVQLQLLHRDTAGRIAPVDFGAATRIPLPSTETPTVRVEANVSIGLSNGNDTKAIFELYEDGRPVVSGQIRPSQQSAAGNTQAVLRVPDDLIAPGAGIDLFPRERFLNAEYTGDCSGVRADRLGDEGCARDFRKRDVTYTIVVRCSNDAETDIDPTPASATFTVAVEDSGAFEDDQPFKETSRGNN